jgi:hypothetical protein
MSYYTRWFANKGFPVTMVYYHSQPILEITATGVITSMLSSSFEIVSDPSLSIKLARRQLDDYAVISFNDDDVVVTFHHGDGTTINSYIDDYGPYRFSWDRKEGKEGIVIRGDGLIATFFSDDIRMEYDNVIYNWHPGYVDFINPDDRTVNYVHGDGTIGLNGKI